MTLRSSILYAFRLIFPRSTDSSGRGRKSLLGAMVCIGISLVPLIAVLAVSDGMIQGITGRIIGLSTQDISVRVRGFSSATLPLFAKKISTVEGVRSATAELQSIALASGKKYRTGATVRSVQPDIFVRNESFASLFTIQEGSADLSDSRNAVIGQKIASDLNLHVGDSLTLITSTSSRKTGIVPKAAVFKVTGIVSCGYQELDALWVFIPFETGSSFFPLSATQCIISIMTDDSFSPELSLIKRRVVQAAGEMCDVYLWNELNAAQYENFASTRILLLLIMLLIVLVASVNISSALVMLVMERRKEIAILKSMGGTREGITFSFLLAGFITGAAGVLLGLPLGLFAAVNINAIISFMEKAVNLSAKFLYLLRDGGAASYTSIHLLDPAYYLQQIPVSVPLRELLVIVLGTLVLSVLVSAVPAVKAGKEKPLETLRRL